MCYMRETDMHFLVFSPGAFENGRISNYEGLVTLTLDRVILHTVVYHSSTSTYMPNFVEIEETFCGRTYVRTDRYLRPAVLDRLFFYLK